MFSEEEEGFTDGLTDYVEVERQKALDSDDYRLRRSWNLMPSK